MEERSSNNELLLKFIKNFDDTVLTKNDKEVVLSIYNIIIDHELSGEDFRNNLVSKNQEIKASQKDNFEDYLNKFYYIRNELINDIAVKSVYVETINQYFMPKIFEIQEQIESSITFKEQVSSTLKEQKKRHQEEQRQIEEYERKQAEEKWKKMVEGNRERKQKRLDDQEKSRAMLQQRHNDTMQEIKTKHQERLKHQEKLQKEIKTTWCPFYNQTSACAASTQRNSRLATLFFFGTTTKAICSSVEFLDKCFRIFFCLNKMLRHINTCIPNMSG